MFSKIRKMLPFIYNSKAKKKKIIWNTCGAGWIQPPPLVMCLQCQGGVKHNCFCIHWFHLICAHYLSSRRFCYVATTFQNGEALALKMTSPSWQSLIRSHGRSFSRHVQHQSQKCNLKRPRINFFIRERYRFMMHQLLFQMHKDWPWKWPHHPDSRSLSPLAGPLAGILSVKVKNITLKGQDSTSSGKEFFYPSTLRTFFL